MIRAAGASPCPGPTPRETQNAMRRRTLIILLAAVAGVCGELLAAVSTTRIAGPVLVAAGQDAGHLGFPYELRWTLFAVISVAGWVGALLWTSPERADRRIGPWLNLPAATGAGLVVGLDHTVHAAPGGWQVLAFAIGPAITLTSSALLHVIARQIAREQAPVPMTVQQHVQMHAAPTALPRPGDSPDSLGGDRDSVTYEPDEGATTTDEAPTPPQGVPSVPERQNAAAEQVAWIVERGENEPGPDDLVDRFGIARRTAFRRIAEARKARGVAS